MKGNQIDGQPVTEEQLLKEGYRKYTGEGIDIFYNKDICEHIGNCVRGNPEVFEVGRKPWIIPDNGSVENDMIVVDSRPSGALKYIRKAGNEYAN
ncbi:TPA: (4Fe-4S)-binding protein [Enterococcus faecalis]|nr:(4Fe-4S)-binding protein [Enterococcus faecalis]HBI3727586.1 (4Fe-4S)-binding protein [Enterococcus faecalis]HBI3730537.1 (4Fe-4S)-binding protein [Enterococcus faecalis]HBI3739767.1 (4Fe-4S)-binding protein [Enterococcus faecalis]HBI3749594.1 (4Fe-4S)-binding protein [Enterococcus faecalis]